MMLMLVKATFESSSAQLPAAIWHPPSHSEQGLSGEHLTRPRHFEVNSSQVGTSFWHIASASTGHCGSEQQRVFVVQQSQNRYHTWQHSGCRWGDQGCHTHTCHAGSTEQTRSKHGTHTLLGCLPPAVGAAMHINAFEGN